RALEGRRRNRYLAKLEDRTARRGERQERVLAKDWIIAFEQVLVERIPPTSGHVRIVVQDRVAPAVAVPLRKADAPAILFRNEMRIGLRRTRQDARTPRETQGRVIDWQSSCVHRPRRGRVAVLCKRVRSWRGSNFVIDQQTPK